MNVSTRTNAGQRYGQPQDDALNKAASQPASKASSQRQAVVTYQRHNHFHTPNRTDLEQNR